MLELKTTCRWCRSDDQDLVRLHVQGVNLLERIQPDGGSTTSSTRYLSRVLDELVALCNQREIPYSETDKAAEKAQQKISLNDFLQEARELIRHAGGNTCDCRTQQPPFEPHWWPARWGKQEVGQC